MNLATDYSRW